MRHCPAASKQNPHPANPSYDGPVSTPPPARASSPVLWWGFLLYSLVAAAHVATIAWGPADWTYPTKLLLMPTLGVAVLLAVYGTGSSIDPRRRRDAMLPPRPRYTAPALLIAAIAFSWLGDGASFFFPMFEDELPLMLLNFGLAHLLYVAIFAFVVRPRPLARWSLVYLAWWLVFVIWLWPHLGDLAVAVAVYGIVLGATAAVSTRGGWLTATGGAVFLASDTILGLQLFVPDALPVAVSSPAVMIAYTIGQGLLAYGISQAVYDGSPRPTGRLDA